MATKHNGSDAALEAGLNVANSLAWERLHKTASALSRGSGAAWWVNTPPTIQHDANGAERVVHHFGYVELRSDAEEAIQCLYDIGAVAPFDWMNWDGMSRFPHGEGLASVHVADAVRVCTTIVRADRFSEGTLKQAIDDGTMQRIVERLMAWKTTAITTSDYDDSAEYSDDGLYRWCFERRWADGPSLCWVGLNPSTSDTGGQQRPTLRKVVARAQAQGMAAVTVVNLFSWRATQPADLKAAAKAGHDIVGTRTDQTIVECSQRATVTLAAWGSHGSLHNRGAQVSELLDHPLCLGVTRHGEPLHPLYVAGTTAAIPYRWPNR